MPTGNDHSVTIDHVRVAVCARLRHRPGAAPPKPVQRGGGDSTMTTRSLAALGPPARLALTACGGPAGTAQEHPAPVRPEASGTTSARISTFALDVDTASYSYTRRALREGRRPEPGHVRPEEFV